MKLTWLLLLLFLSIARVNAQLPDHWGAPTELPTEGADRVVLYTNDSAQVAIKMLASLLEAQGFQVDFHDQIGITTHYKMIAEILGMKGVGAIAVTIVVSQEIPGVLTISGNSVSQVYARKMLHEIRAKRADVHRKQKSNACASAFGKANSEAAQNGFSALTTIAKAYPNGRVLYVKTGQ